MATKEKEVIEDHDDEDSTSESEDDSSEWETDEEEGNTEEEEEDLAYRIQTHDLIVKNFRFLITPNKSLTDSVRPLKKVRLTLFVIKEFTQTEEELYRTWLTMVEFENSSDVDYLKTLLILDIDPTSLWETQGSVPECIKMVLEAAMEQVEEAEVNDRGLLSNLMTLKRTSFAVVIEDPEKSTELGVISPTKVLNCLENQIFAVYFQNKHIQNLVSEPEPGDTK